MLVSDPPRHPRFGATYERLRYDAPISIRDSETGAYSSIPCTTRLEARACATSWSGCRAGRGSSSGAGRATSRSGPAGTTPAPATSGPRSSRSRPARSTASSRSWTRSCATARVEIVESTPARVHVRWSYQSTDFNYKVWGDAAVEDYYFYPDGFGTRVVNLKADPKNDYELSEFIILTPQGAYPFDGPAGRPGRRPVPRRPQARLSVPEPNWCSDGRPTRRTAKASRRSIGCGLSEDDDASRGLLQPERDEAPARGLRAVLRQGRDGHALLLGQPLAARAGQLDRQRRSTTASSSPPATTA